MQLKEILRLRRDSASGQVPMDVLRRLRLPMPDDVLEQFVGDHGVKGPTLEQYGDLDLHALHWNLVSASASEIVACSVYPDYREYLDATRQKTLDVPTRGWKKVYLPDDAKSHWQAHRTWR